MNLSLKINQLALLCSVLITLLAGRSHSPPLCVQWENDTGARGSVMVSLGSAMRLSFRHSIYNSQVEERFALYRDGFQLVELRYGEARLVDFYGHEHGRFDNGAWVVKPDRTPINQLNLRASRDAALSVIFAPPASDQQIVVHPNSALRLTVDECYSRIDG